MTLGERIRLIRQQKKLSQADLASMASIHQKNISKYEQDAVVPSAITLKSIANALDVTTDYLLGNDDNTVKDTALLKQLKDIDNMPEKDKSSLVSVIDAFIRDYKARMTYAN